MLKIQGVTNTDQSGEKHPLLGAQCCPPTCRPWGMLNFAAGTHEGGAIQGNPHKGRWRALQKKNTRKSKVFAVCGFLGRCQVGWGYVPMRRWCGAVAWELCDASAPRSRAVCHQESPRGKTTTADRGHVFLMGRGLGFFSHNGRRQHFPSENLGFSGDHGCLQEGVASRQALNAALCSLKEG